MTRSGDHRIRSLARWLATPILIGAAGFVAYAVLQGEVTMLRIAAVSAMGAAVIAVALFDYELIRNRRNHGAERVTQARAYAAMYAAHVRVMTSVPSMSVRADLDPVKPADGSDAWVEDVAPISDAPPVPDALVEIPELQIPETLRIPESLEADEVAEPEEVAEPVMVPQVEAAADVEDSPAMWDSVGDAPTVVDLIAWEVKARLAADGKDAEQAETAEHAEPAQNGAAEADPADDAEAAAVASESEPSGESESPEQVAAGAESASGPGIARRPRKQVNTRRSQRNSNQRKGA